MNESFLDTSPRPRRCDPREVLDPPRRLTVLALLRLGGSRRMAARQAGCAHTTIARTAAREAGFAAQLAEAENEAARDALRPPRGAEAEAKLGRTAAWIARQGACKQGSRPKLRATYDESDLSILEQLIAAARLIEQEQARRRGA